MKFRLRDRRALHGLPSRSSPERGGFLEQSRLRAVARQHLRLRLGDVGEMRFESLRDPHVQGAPRLAQQGAVSQILQEGVFEEVRRVRRDAPPRQQTGPYEMLERRVQVRFRQVRRQDQQRMRGFTADRCGDLRDFLGRAHPIEPRHQRGLQGRGNRQGSAPCRFALALRLQYCLRHLLDEQRHAVAALDDVPADGRRQLPRAGDGADHDVDVALVQPIEDDRRDVGLPGPRREEFRPEAYDQQRAKRPDAVHDAVQRFEARGVRPLRVLEDHQHRVDASSRLQLRHERLQGSLPAQRRRKVDRRVASVVLQGHHLGDERCVLGRGRGVPQQRVELVELGLRRVVAREPRGALHLADDGKERVVGALRRAEPARQRQRFAGQSLDERGGEPRLADPGLAGKEDHLSFSLLRPRPAPQQQVAFFASPDERRQRRSVQRLEPAGDWALAQRRPDLRGSRDPLEVSGSQILKLEEIAEKLSRAPVDDHTVGLGDPLQPRREVRRVADDASLLRLSGHQKIADHHVPRRDADTHVQRGACRRIQLGCRGDDRERRAHRVLGVLFVSLGIAEVGEQAVAHVFGDEAAVGRDEACAACVIGCEDVSHVLGIEPRGKRGRADEIDNHHGETAALGGGRFCDPCRHRPRDRRSPVAFARQLFNRGQEPTAMPHRDDAKVFEVFRRQLWKNLKVDGVLAKRSFVLAETELTEPIGDRHGIQPIDAPLNASGNPSRISQ